MKPIHFIPVIGIILFFFAKDKEIAYMRMSQILCLGLFQGASIVGILKLLELFT